jgi:uncharacterized protein (DUF58 family)
MALFDSELLSRFHYLSLVARQAGGRSLLAQPRRQKLPCGGTEVTALRDYAPGDDYRHVDWTWCARRDELLSKVFEGEVDLHAYVLLDCSPSMGFGGGAKFRLARQVAAVLGYVALANLDRLSVTVFSQGIVTELPPLRGRNRIATLFRFLDQLPLSRTQTNLAQTAEAFTRRSQRRGPVVVLSDLYDRSGFRRGLDILRYGGYEPRVVQIHDPREAEPGLLGDVELLDIGTGSLRQVTVTERAARRYRQLFAEFLDSVRDYCASHTIPCLQLVSDASEEDVFLRVLGVRRTGISDL